MRRCNKHGIDNITDVEEKMERNHIAVANLSKIHRNSRDWISVVSTPAWKSLPSSSPSIGIEYNVAVSARPKMGTGIVQDQLPGWLAVNPRIGRLAMDKTHCFYDSLFLSPA